MRAWRWARLPRRQPISWALLLRAKRTRRSAQMETAMPAGRSATPLRCSQSDDELELEYRSMIRSASRSLGVGIALAAILALSLPDAGPVFERSDVATVFADENEPAMPRDDLEEEISEDEDTDQSNLEGLRTISPSQIQRLTVSPSHSRWVSA